MSTTVVAERPAGAAPRPYDFPPTTRFELDNGLRVVVTPMPGRELVSASLVIRSGAADEPAELGGATVLAARALTEGTEVRDAIALTEAAERLGASIHAGHWDAGFTDTATWPVVGEGVRLGVIAMGPVLDGPLFLCWDRAPGSGALHAFEAGADLLQLVVDGSVLTDTDTVPRLGFRLHQEGARVEGSRPGPDGAKELWLFADRRRVPDLGKIRGLVGYEPRVHLDEILDQVAAYFSSAEGRA